MTFIRFVNIKMLLFLTLISIILFSCKSNKQYSENMKLELKRMYREDQNAQNFDLEKLSLKKYTDSMNIEFDKICKKNIIVVKKYYKDYGFPGIKENGKETALNFWLIVQHADNDVEFQKKILISMKKLFKSNNVNKRNYAFLFDRIKKNEQKPQLYGTQMIWDSNGIHTPYNLESPKEVNKRRLEMDLGTIEEYLKEFN